jgi:TATA-binding protein-associated factor Taf7
MPRKSANERDLAYLEKSLSRTEAKIAKVRGKFETALKPLEDQRFQTRKAIQILEESIEEKFGQPHAPEVA